MSNFRFVSDEAPTTTTTTVFPTKVELFGHRYRIIFKRHRSGWTDVLADVEGFAYEPEGVDAFYDEDFHPTHETVEAMFSDDYRCKGDLLGAFLDLGDKVISNCVFNIDF